MQVALPELDGALEPIVFAGRDSNTGKSHSLPVRHCFYLQSIGCKPHWLQPCVQTPRAQQIFRPCKSVSWVETTAAAGCWVQQHE